MNECQATLNKHRAPIQPKNEFVAKKKIAIGMGSTMPKAIVAPFPNTVPPMRE